MRTSAQTARNSEAQLVNHFGGEEARFENRYVIEINETMKS